MTEGVEYNIGDEVIMLQTSWGCLEGKIYEVCRKEFVYSNIKGGYLGGDGICLYCGEIFPLILEEHHMFGKSSDTTITLCTKHHVYFTRGYWKLLGEW